MGAFQTSDCNTHGYYIVKWTGNAYTLQKEYKCHAFDPPVIIPEGELVFPAKVMTPTIKTSYWYHEPYEAILIELIQDKNTKNIFSSCFKGNSDMNRYLLSEHNHQIILDKIEARKNINHNEYVEYENYYNVDSDDYNENDN